MSLIKRVKNTSLNSGKGFGGFTIIEVTLFLAISGLLLLIVAYGIGSNQRNTEFHDSMQSTADFLNQQINAIQSGVNLRSNNLGCSYSGGLVQVTSGSDNTGSAGNCIFLGRIYMFNSSTTQITGYDIVGTRQENVGPCSSRIYGLPNDGSAQLNALDQHCPTILGVDSGTGNNSAPSYGYSWSTQLLGGVGRNNPTGEDFNSNGTYRKVYAVLILRSPDNGTLFPAIYESGTPALTTNINSQFCYKGGASYYGAIYLGGSFQNGGASAQTGTNNLFNVKVDDPSCDPAQWGTVQ